MLSRIRERMFKRYRAFLCGLIIVLGAFVARPAYAADLMTADALAPLYAAELGPLYHPSDLDRIYDAHQLLEGYFVAATQSQRQHIEKQLESYKLPVELLGRIARLRLSWQEIPGGIYYINMR